LSGRQGFRCDITVNAVWARLRVDVRRRWRAWLGVALLVGLFGGIVTATAAGARRTDTAYSRFLVANHGAGYMIEDFIPNPDAAVVDPQAVAALPSIAEADLFRMYGTVGDVGYNLVASPDGRAFGTGLNRLKVLQGRPPDPARADEAVADFTMPGARVGQRVSIPLISSRAGDTHTADYPAGPVLATFTVVGIVAAPAQFPPFAANRYFTGPSYYLTPAFYQAHETSVAALKFTLVRLRPGAASAAQHQVEALGRGRPVALEQLGGQARDVNRSIHLVAVALWLLAGLLMVVAVLVLGQLLARQTVLDAADYPVLRSLGMTRRQLAGLAVGRCTAIGAVGAALAVGVAIALSPLMPIGLARAAEPTPGLACDALVLVTAGVGIPAIAAMLALWPAWRAAKAASPAFRTGDRDGLGRRSMVADASARAGLPATLTAGVRMALERGRGPTSVPVRTTIGGAIVGLGALVASLTFGASLSHLLRSPPLYGVTWDTEIWNNDGPGAVPAAEPVVRADPDVATAAFIQTGIDFRLGGRLLSGFAFAPVKGTFAASMLTGRAPAAPDEVALGARTAAQLDARVGTTLLGNAENEGAPQVPVRVVGTVVLPPGDPTAHLGDGVMVTRQALVRLVGGQARSPYVIAVAFRPGVNTAEAIARLDHQLAAVDQSFFTRSPTTPTDLVNFGRIQDLPLILGSALAVTALLTVAHLLTTSIRRRRRDLAILKTLGFARGDVGRTVAWQATTLAVVALAAAVPLGVAVGRTAWRLFADQLGVIPDVSTPVVLLALVVPATVLLANLISIGPAVAAMRTHPAAVLREE
jgi:ABC-type lipoprotein release transport system permease subunit